MNIAFLFFFYFLCWGHRQVSFLHFVCKIQSLAWQHSIRLIASPWRSSASSFCVSDSSDWRAPSCSTHTVIDSTKAFPPSPRGMCVSVSRAAFCPVLPAAKTMQIRRGNNSCQTGTLRLVLLPRASCRRTRRDGWGGAAARRRPAQPPPKASFSTAVCPRLLGEPVLSVLSDISTPLDCLTDCWI